MITKELEKLSIEELRELFCNFYNDIDEMMLNIKNSKESKVFSIMNLFGTYVPNKRKVLDKIKPCNRR